MSATVYVCADQEKGGSWNFGQEQLARIAAEVRPGSTVSGPLGKYDAHHFTIPSSEGDWTREVIYMPHTMGFSFEDDDETDLTAGLVFQILLQLAPDVPALWISTIDSEPHPIQIAGRTEAELVRELW